MKTKLLSEFIGTALLLLAIVGSGILGTNLGQGNLGIALSVNSVLTGVALFFLIKVLGPLSGAHFNPGVSLVETFWGRLDKKILPLYWIAQFLGAIIGVFCAHLIFSMDILQVSSTERVGTHLWVSEIIATFGLICTIALAGKKKVEMAPVCIALYITSAYWFTSSTSFANPAVTLARSFTDTFCGIAPSGVIPFFAAQLVGAVLAFALLKNVSLQVQTNSK